MSAVSGWGHVQDGEGICTKVDNDVIMMMMVDCEFDNGDEDEC